jgi:hypothetical protein
MFVANSRLTVQIRALCGLLIDLANKAAGNACNERTVVESVIDVMLLSKLLIAQRSFDAVTFAQRLSLDFSSNV